MSSFMNMQVCEWSNMVGYTTTKKEREKNQVELAAP